MGTEPYTQTENTPQVRTSAPSLQVADRVSVGVTRGLAEEFRSRGFPAKTAVMGYDEYEQRAVTWTGSLNAMAPIRREGVDLPADRRYLYRFSPQSRLTPAQPALTWCVSPRERLRRRRA